MLPWIPLTTAAVALRLMEFDAAISNMLQQKLESHREKESGHFIVSDFVLYHIIYFRTESCMCALEMKIKNATVNIFDVHVLICWSVILIMSLGKILLSCITIYLLVIESGQLWEYCTTPLY